MGFLYGYSDSKSSKSRPPPPAAPPGRDGGADAKDPPGSRQHAGVLLRVRSRWGTVFPGADNHACFIDVETESQKVPPKVSRPRLLAECPSSASKR